MSLATRVLPQALSAPDIEETASDGIYSKTFFTWPAWDITSLLVDQGLYAIEH